MFVTNVLPSVYVIEIAIAVIRVLVKGNVPCIISVS